MREKTSAGRASSALVTLTLLLLSLRAAVDEPRLFSHYQRVQYDTEQGLPTDQVHGIAQTPDGFMWFGTRDGLARFDGIRFTVFRSENNPGLTHNVIVGLMADHLGRLWIPTLKGLSCYEHGNFRSYGRDDGLPNLAIHTMLEGHDGKLWFGTWGGLAVFDGTHFHSLTTKDGLPQNVVFALAEDRQGGIWVGTQGGLAYLKNGSFRVYTTRDGLPSNEIDRLLLDHRGRLWVATERGFARLVTPGHFEKIRELDDGSPSYLLEDEMGTVWASSTVSIARLAPRKTRFQVEAVTASEAPIEMFEDRNGSMWLTTTHAGLICYRWQPSVSFTTQDGLADNFVLNFYEDSRGTLWIATAGGLSQRSHGIIRTVRAFNSLHVGEVQSFAEDHEHRIWVGTSNGLVRFDRNRWQRMRTSPIPLPLDIGAICVDRKDRIWIGSTEGLFIWDHGILSRFIFRKGQPGTYISAIVEDREGRIWAATDFGLTVIEDRRVAAVYTTENGLLSNWVIGLFTSSDGALWICTFSGLNRWKDGHLQKVTKPGLPIVVVRLAEDDQDYFWLESYRGVFRVKKEDLERLSDRGSDSSQPSYTRWGPENGLRISISGVPNQSTICKTVDGTLWFATTKGIVALKASDLHVTFSTPEVLMESVNVDGESVRASSLKPGIRRLEFAFTAPTSQTPEQLEFRYQLDGFDHDWHDVGAQRLASFTNLPRGKYLFRVSVKRDGGSWNPKEATFAFQILPYWYESLTFRVLCGLVLVLLFWFAHLLRLRQTRQRLRVVFAERARVANELHDTLLQTLSGAAMQVRAGLSHLENGAPDGAVDRFSAALDQMGRSQAEARQAIWELTSSELNGNYLAQSLQERARQLCGDLIALECTISGDTRHLDTKLEEQLYRIAVEAITNAARHSGASKIAVDLNFGTNALILSVQDDGCGFDQAAQTSSDGVHFGLRSMRQRAQRCGGELRISSHSGQGTTICLEVPSKRATPPRAIREDI
jgi:ligand-binding sensor domain-containing protein/signal transduction histidine kinase